jgi:hypothetical protein
MKNKISKGVFYLDHEEFLEMAEVYKESPCPVCESPNLIYNGYTFDDGSMVGAIANEL